MIYIIDHAGYISSASYAGSVSSASYQTSSTDTAGTIEEQATIKPQNCTIFLVILPILFYGTNHTGHLCCLKILI
jgi:hypothetical protein